MIAQLCYLGNFISFIIDIFDMYYNPNKADLISSLKDASPKEKLILSNWVKIEELFQILAKNWILLNCLIQPAHNLILVVLWNLKSVLLKFILRQISSNGFSKLPKESNDFLDLKNYFYLFYIIMQSCYFTQGNSNSLNTIQISSGMVGINYINEPLIVLLLLSATYSSHVYWFFELVQYLACDQINFLTFLIEKRSAPSSKSFDKM